MTNVLQIKLYSTAGAAAATCPSNTNATRGSEQLTIYLTTALSESLIYLQDVLLCVCIDNELERNESVLIYDSIRILI